LRNSEGIAFALAALEAQDESVVPSHNSATQQQQQMPQPHHPHHPQQFEQHQQQQQQQRQQHHPQMIQHVPGMYFPAPNTSANFMQPTPGMPINVQGMMSGHGMEPSLPHQFPLIHAQPQQFVNPYPMHSDFMSSGQYQHNRMQMPYPYPYPNHPNLINQNQNQNPLQIFQDQVRQQHWGVQTPAQVYSLLSQEYKKLVDNTIPTVDFLNRADVKKIVHNLATGAMSLNDLLQQIVGPQQALMAGILRHALQGGFPIRGVLYAGHGMMPSHMHGGQFPPHMHFVPNQVRMAGYQQQPSQRPTGQMMQPISFMPTPVMRKMTAEQHVRQIIPTPVNSNPQQPPENQNSPTQEDDPNLNVEN